MKCPNCKEEMEKGWISSNGTRWAKGDPSSFVGATWPWLKSLSGPLLLTFRCPKCGKVELTTEVEK